jgi:ABC-type sugar transport system substrate-binding protein
MAQQFSRPVREANKTDKVKIIAFDEEDETLTGLKTARSMRLSVQQPFEFGFRSMELMSKILNGDKSGVPASKQIFVPTKGHQERQRRSVYKRDQYTPGTKLKLSLWQQTPQSSKWRESANDSQALLRSIR